MRFWDSSAITQVCVPQAATNAVFELLREDSSVAVWWGTPVECWSAFARLRRQRIFSAGEEEAARRVLHSMQHVWFEIMPGEDVRGQAGRLLRVHPIRAADALQLAAALVWAGIPPAGEIVVFDQRLREAARLEGLVPRP